MANVVIQIKSIVKALRYTLNLMLSQYIISKYSISSHSTVDSSIDLKVIPI